MYMYLSDKGVKLFTPCKPLANKRAKNYGTNKIYEPNGSIILQPIRFGTSKTGFK